MFLNNFLKFKLWSGYSINETDETEIETNEGILYTNGDYTAGECTLAEYSKMSNEEKIKIMDKNNIPYLYMPKDKRKQLENVLFSKEISDTFIYEKYLKEWESDSKNFKKIANMCFFFEINEETAELLLKVIEEYEWHRGFQHSQNETNFLKELDLNNNRFSDLRVIMIDENDHKFVGLCRFFNGEIVHFNGESYMRRGTILEVKETIIDLIFRYINAIKPSEELLEKIIQRAISDFHQFI